MEYPATMELSNYIYPKYQSTRATILAYGEGMGLIFSFYI